MEVTAMSAAPDVTFKSPADPAQKVRVVSEGNDPKPEEIFFVEIRDEIIPHVTPGRSRRSPGQLKIDARVRVNYGRWDQAGRPGKETPWLQCPLDCVVVPHKVAEHTRYMIRKACELIEGERCKPRFGRYGAKVEELPEYILEILTEHERNALRSGYDLVAFTVYVES